MKKSEISEIEKEAKNLLLEEEFQALKKYFLGSTGTIVQQINRYFDSSDRSILKSLPAGSTLRVRDKKGSTTLEFKLPKSNGDVDEYKDILHEMTYENLFNNGILPDGNVKRKLQELGIQGKFEYLGDLETLRGEAVLNNEWPGTKIFLDESTYPGGLKDYEIEIESDDIEKSHGAMNEILKVFQIPLRDTPRKIQRFYVSIG